MNEQKVYSTIKKGTWVGAPLYNKEQPQGMVDEHHAMDLKSGEPGGAM